jgi:hypothetical protein
MELWTAPVANRVIKHAEPNLIAAAYYRFRGMKVTNLFGINCSIYLYIYVLYYIRFFFKS